MYGSFPTSLVRSRVGIGALASADQIGIPGNPGAYVTPNGQTIGPYSTDAFLSAMANGQGYEYVAWMQAHGLPVAYGNPATEQAWLEHYGYHYQPPESTASNPIYSVEFAKTGNLPPGSNITPGSGSNFPSPSPINAPSGTFPTAGQGGGTGNYSSTQVLPGEGGLTNLLKDNGLLIAAGLAGLFLFMRK